MRRRPLFLVLLGLQLTAFDASAQPAAAPPAGAATAQDDADRLFREANELYKQKRFADAEALYEQAFAKKPAHDIASNLGYAEMHQNKLVEAAGHIAYAVRMWPPTGKDDKRQGAVERLAKVKADIATITIEVNVAGARVFVGERQVGVSPLATEVFADAGRVVVRAKRDGYRDAEQTLDAAKGSAQAVKLAMEAEVVVVPTASASVTATAVTPPSRSAVPAIVLGGAGIIAAGMGIGMNVLAQDGNQSTKALSDDIRAKGGTCVEDASNFDARCDDLIARARANDVTSRASVGLLVGAGALAIGATLYWFWPGAARVNLGASVVPTGTSATVSLRVRGAF